MKLTRFVTDLLSDIKHMNSSVQSFTDTRKQLLIIIIIIIVLVVSDILYNLAVLEKNIYVLLLYYEIVHWVQQYKKI